MHIKHSIIICFLMTKKVKVSAVARADLQRKDVSHNKNKFRPK